MLRLAVVMKQVGPLNDYGLEGPDQSGIDDKAMFVGTLPYGASYESNTDTNKKEDPRGKSEKDKSGVKVTRKPKRQGGIAIDFDGTLTLDPKWFKSEIDRASGAGVRCHLVTGRPEAERGIVEDFCRMYGIKFASMNFYPRPYKYSKDTWDALMDVEIGAWKSKCISDLKADVVVDDNEIYISQIAKGNPGILILKPVGRI